MKKLIILFLLIFASFLGVIFYLQTDEVNEKIGALRIKESCVDIFAKLKVKTQNVKVLAADLSLTEALESEAERYKEIDSNAKALEIAKELVEQHYSRGKAMLRVTVYSEPALFCSYTGYDINRMRFEGVSLGLKHYNSSEMFKVKMLNSFKIKNNTTGLSIEDLTLINRMSYIMDIL